MIIKTRGNSEPQGKPKIFFTGHQDDMNLYYDEYSELIMKKCNCAVCTEEPEDDLNEILPEMQMIVLFVTSRLLYEDNTARKDIIPYVLEKHIPVLPLIMEKGIEENASEVLGGIQLINPFDTDPTAITFDEKITKFINSVIISDELAAKVRMAFDAYIFLSYRKKDRKYANELMRLIHKNPFCESIAIWYDEYLVPGSEFREAIREALLKSDLFVMLITNNLLENGNYVQQVEYPTAQKEGKPILPVGMEYVDRLELEDRFPSVPPVCDVLNDSSQLSEMLLNNLMNNIMTERENEPEHTFFMGLAYLSGIDVEINHEKALRLIQDAANKDLPEAVKKLSDMYFTGNGVERDSKKALSLLEHYAELKLAIYEADKTTENADEYIEIMNDYTNQIYVFEDLEKTYQSYKDLKQASMKMAVELQSPSYLLFSVESSLKMSRMLIDDIHDPEYAKKILSEAISLAKLLNNNLNTEKTRKKLAWCYSFYGDIYYGLWQYDEAEKQYMIALEMFQAIMNDYPSLINRENTGLIYDSLSRLYNRKKDSVSEEEYAIKSLEILEKTFAENPDDCTYYVTALEKYAYVLMKKKKYSEAESYFLRILELSLAVYEKTGSTHDYQNVGISYLNLGRCKSEEKEYEASIRYLEKATDIAETNFEKRAYPNYAYEAAVCNEDLGRQHHLLKDEFGGQIYQKAIALDPEYEKYVDKTFEHQSWAIKYYNRALELREVVLEKSQRPYDRFVLIRINKRLAEVCPHYIDRKFYIQKYQDECRKFLEYIKSNKIDEEEYYEKKLLKAYDDLLQFGKKNGECTLSHWAAVNWLELKRKMVPEPKTESELRLLSIGYKDTAEQSCNIHDFKNAADLYANEFKTRNKILLLTEKEEDYLRFAVSIFNLATVPYDTAVTDANLKTVFELCLTLEKKFPDNPRFAELKEKSSRYIHLINDFTMSEKSVEAAKQCDESICKALYLQDDNNYSMSFKLLDQHWNKYLKIAVENHHLLMLLVLRNDLKNACRLSHLVNEKDMEKIFRYRQLEVDKLIAEQTGIYSDYKCVRDDYSSYRTSYPEEEETIFRDAQKFYSDLMKKYPNEESLKKDSDLFK